MLLTSLLRLLSPRRDQQAEHKTAHKPAQVRGHADLRRRQIECGLDRHNRDDVFQATAGQGFVAVP